MPLTPLLFAEGSHRDGSTIPTSAGLGRALTDADVRAWYLKYYGKAASQEAVNVWLQRPYSAEEVEVMIRDAGIDDGLYTPSANEPVINIPVNTPAGGGSGTGTGGGSGSGGGVSLFGVTLSPLVLGVVVLGGLMVLGSGKR